MSYTSHRLFNEMPRNLLAIILFCLSSCAPTPHEQEAASKVCRLAEAVLSFNSQYGYNPVPTNKMGLTTMGAALPVLLALSNSTSAAELNPQAIHFLDVPPHRLQHGEYLDPWENPYHLAIANADEHTTEVGGTIISAPVAVWSDGRNGKDESGRGDDICSWKSLVRK